MNEPITTNKYETSETSNFRVYISEEEANAMMIGDLIEQMPYDPLCAYCLKNVPDMGEDAVFVPYKALRDIVRISEDMNDEDFAGYVNSDLSDFLTIMYMKEDVGVQLNARLPDGTEGIRLICLAY